MCSHHIARILRKASWSLRDAQTEFMEGEEIKIHHRFVLAVFQKRIGNSSQDLHRF